MPFTERLSNGDVKVVTTIIDRNLLPSFLKEIALIDQANTEEEIAASKTGW